MHAEIVSRDSAMERDLVVLGLRSPEEFPDKLRLPSPRFACLLAWDARSAEAHRVADLARKLLDAGAVYVSVWGPDTRRIHEAIEWEEAGSGLTLDEGHAVLTSRHDHETLADAIWFALHCSWPDESLEDGCTTTLGLAIGSDPWRSEIARAFEDPRGFSARIDAA